MRLLLRGYRVNITPRHGGGAPADWSDRFPGTVTHSTHVQMFNPLAGTETTGGNATLTPHPVTSGPAGHSHRGGVYRAAWCAYVRSGPHTGHVRNTHTWWCGLCAAAENAGSAVYCDKHRRAVSSSPRNAQAGNEWRVKQASKQEKRARKHPHPAAVNAALTLSYRSQKAFILVIPRREELQHFIRLHLSAERNGFKQQCLAHQLEDGIGFFFFFSPLFPPLCDLPPPLCLSAALWRNSRGVQKRPSPVCCLHSPQDSAQANTTQLWCQIWKKKTLRACIHLSTHCHIWGFSITQF